MNAPQEPPPFLSMRLVDNPADAYADRQRTCAALAVLCQLGVLTLLGGWTVSQILLALLTLCVWLSPKRLDVRYRQRSWMLLLVLLLFAARNRFLPYEIPSGRTFISSPLLLTLAEAVSAMQLLLMAWPRPSGRIPPIFSGLGFVALVFACDVQASDSERVVLPLLVVPAVGCLIGVFVYHARRAAATVPRRPKSHAVLASLLFLLTLGATAGAGNWLFNYEKRLDEYILSWLDPPSDTSQVGFSARSRLGSVKAVKSQNEDSVALTIESQADPGYVRGQVFDTYRGEEWSTTRDRETLLPSRDESIDGLDLWPTDELFRLRPPTDGRQFPMTVRQQIDTEGDLFLPLRAELLAIDEERLLQGTYETIEARDFLPGGSYRVGVATTPVRDRLSEIERNRLLTLPDHLEDLLSQSAGRLFDGATTSLEKQLRVAAYFHSNYKYRFGIDVPPGVDPLFYFLTERPAAHCEYFATATALLLRAGGVPTRYVTGFVVVDRSPLSDEWTVRNKHAHAWVEAYDDVNGWTIVESTPSDGLPQSLDDRSQAGHVWDSVRAWWQRVQDRWSRGGWPLIRDDLVGFFFGPAGLLLAFYVLWRLRSFLRDRRPNRPREPTLSPGRQELRAALDRLLKSLAKRNRQPTHSETLTEFADRLATDSDEDFTSEAAWLREYVSLRYRISEAAAEERSEFVQRRPA